MFRLVTKDWQKFRRCYQTFKESAPLYSNQDAVHQVVLTNNGSTFIAWHPEKAFPYECTKPLPEAASKEDTSILKTSLTSELKSIFHKKSPEQARSELMSITHTTKHRWFPRARDKKAKRTQMDREYL